MLILQILQGCIQVLDRFCVVIVKNNQRKNKTNNMRRSLRKIKVTQQPQPTPLPIKQSKTLLNITQQFPHTTITHHKDLPKRVLRSSQLNRLIASREHTKSVSIQRSLESQLGIQDRIRGLCGSSGVIREFIESYGIGEQVLRQVEEVVYSKYCSQGENGLEAIAIETMKKKVGIIQCEAACREKQNYISSLFDQRIQRLQTILNKK